jgi:photosystem II stability/assembly factor-like uncharacterized protein
LIVHRIIQGVVLSICLGGTCALAQSVLTSPQLEILGPYGGDVRSLAIDPANSKILYAGTTDGTIFKSTDAAGTWKRLSPGIGRRGMVINRLVADPADPRTLYAVAWQLTSSGGGLFRSRDGGATWEEAFFDTAVASLRCLAIAPSNNQILYAGTLRGVFKSIDAGKKWKYLRGSNYIIHGVESMVVDPKNPDLVLAGSRRMAYRSDDGGENWIPVVKGMQQDSDIFDLLPIPGEAPRVLASACTGIFLSQDGGISWQHALLTAAAAKEIKNRNPKDNKMKERTRCLARDPRNPQLVYAGTTVGLFRSSDGGANWERSFGPDLVVNAIAVDPSDSNRVFLGVEDLGVLLSTDRGSRFEKVNQGLMHRNVSAVIADRQNPARLFMGVLFDNAEGGIFRSLDAGKSWSPASAGIALQDRNIFALCQHPARADIYLAGSSAGLYTSADGGATWSKIPEQQVSDKIAVLAGAGSGGRALLLAGGSAGLFASPTGTAWHGIPLGDRPRPVSALAFSGKSPDRFLVGTQGQVWITEDAGNRWRVSRMGLPSIPVQALLCPEGWEGNWFLGGRRGIYRSRNQGGTWEPVAGNLGAQDITSLIVIPGAAKAPAGRTAGTDQAGNAENSQAVQSLAEMLRGQVNRGKFLLLAAEALSGDLLVSSDGGAVWQRVPMTRGGSRIWALWADRVPGVRLFAGTASDGIYALDFSAAGRSAVPPAAPR